MPKTPTFVGGLAVCLLAAALMITGMLDVGWGAALGMVGVGVIAAGSAARDHDASPGEM